MNQTYSNPALEGMLKAGQAMMQGFLEQWSQAGAAPSGSALPLPVDAEKLAALQREHMNRHAQLWASMTQSRPGEPAEPIVKPAAGDRRFVSEHWGASPVFDYIRQSYLLNAQFLSAVADSLPVADRQAKNRIQFLTRQYIDAMSPANFAATNPEFIQRALETKGESITQGLMNLIGDMEKGRISMTDDTAFEVGRNLATTPGAVVYENDVMQLIQYTPTTDKVTERPLLIVPPCINKYYILDLQPENSYVRYIVEQGVPAFLVSWRNPQAEHAHLTWDDYVEHGVLQGLQVVREITRVDKPNVLGFCIGGTLTASAIAVARARGEDPVESMTLLTALLDFTETGDIACFVDEHSVASKEATIGRRGLMAGRELSNVFSSLRPNDLVWNYVVDNYLKGNKPTAFDLLYWNSDSTNLPGPFAAWYLRNTYLENNLRVPGKLSMLGQPVDLGRIDCPTYFLSCREDHIVPWKTSYLGRRLLGGDTTFVLGASGHIAGVVNPASKNKRSHWVGDGASMTADEWFGSATEKPGSWWPHWMEWLKARSGKSVEPRARLGSREHKMIEPAPGRYVKERI